MTDAKRHAGGSPSRLDHSSLRGEPGASHTHYSIALHGGVDERWTQAFRAVCAQSTANRVFVLNPRSGTISFSCRTLEGPAHVFEMLERLESLLAIVDRRLALAPIPRGSITPPAPAASAQPRKPAH